MEIQESDTVREAKLTLAKLDTRDGLIDVYLGQGADEEYNPSQPNEYEKLMIRRGRVRKEMEARIEKDRILKEHIEATKRA